MNTPAARYQSFQRNGGWRHPPHFVANPLRLAQVGFFFRPVPQGPDRVECFCCGTAVARWKPHSDPRTEHLRYSPNCPFLNGNYEKYRFEAARLQTFVGKWTLPEDHLAQPWRLAKAGFYHSPKPGGNDRVECFCCGIALVRWEKGDDPWREHQKHSPTCAFVRGLPTDNVLMPGVLETPTPAKKTEMEELCEEIERLNINYDPILPSSYICPITQDLIRNPIVLEDGHTYEKSAIYAWLSTHNTSPLTNKPLTTKLLFPNHNLKSQLVEFAQKLIDDYKSASGSSSPAPAPSQPTTTNSCPALAKELPQTAASSTSTASSLPAVESGPWIQPILEATDELVEAYRALQLTKDTDAAPEAQEKYEAAEAKVKRVEQEAVGARAAAALAEFQRTEEERIHEQTERIIAEASERAAQIISDAEKQAVSIVQEETAQLQERHASLISSIEQLSRQQTALEAQVLPPAPLSTSPKPSLFSTSPGSGALYPSSPSSYPPLYSNHSLNPSSTSTTTPTSSSIPPSATPPSPPITTSSSVIIPTTETSTATSSSSSTSTSTSTSTTSASTTSTSTSTSSTAPAAVKRKSSFAQFFGFS